MKRHLRFLQAALATLLLWCALPAVAGELPPLSLADAKAKQAVILDTRASYFYQGWPMEGEKQGGHVAGAENLSAEWKYSDEEWPKALEIKGLKADRPVALYGASREVAEVARLLRKQGIKQLFELQGWQAAPRESLARWQQLVYPRWLADLQEGKPVAAAPKGDWKLFEVDWGSPKAYLISHIPGAGYIDTNSLEEEPLWNKVSDEALKKLLLDNGIRHDTTVILYGRNTMAAARAAHLMMYAGVEDVRLLDGGLDAWFVQHLRTETGLPNKYEPVKEFGVAIPAHPEYYTTLSQAKELLKQPDSALVSVRTWDEFVGNTSGYSYIKPKGDIPGGQVGSWWRRCQQHERLPQPGRHHEAGPRDPRHVGPVEYRANPAGCVLLRYRLARLRGLLLRLADGLETDQRLRRRLVRVEFRSQEPDRDR